MVIDHLRWKRERGRERREGREGNGGVTGDGGAVVSNFEMLMFWGRT